MKRDPWLYLQHWPGCDSRCSTCTQRGYPCPTGRRKRLTQVYPSCGYGIVTGECKEDTRAPGGEDLTPPEGESTWQVYPKKPPGGHARKPI